MTLDNELALTRICELCKQKLSISKFHLGGSGKHRLNCHKCMADRYKAQLKLAVFAHFGFKCNCCGEQNLNFLTLDHVNGCISGYRDGKNKEQLYRECIKDRFDSSKYQLLCMNCNFDKGHYGECSHKKGITPTDQIAELVKKADRSLEVNSKRYKNNLIVHEVNIHA